MSEKYAVIASGAAIQSKAGGWRAKQQGGRRAVSPRRPASLQKAGFLHFALGQFLRRIKSVVDRFLPASAAENSCPTEVPMP